jgi:hypothetical protein
MLKLKRQVWRLELGLDLRTPPRLEVWPLKEVLEDLPIRDAILEARELERLLREA